MTIFYAMAAIAVIVVVVLMAVGRLGQLDDPPTDRPGPQLRTDQIQPEDLRSVRFPIVFRGYRMRDVDELLVRLAEEMVPQGTRVDAVLAPQTDPARVSESVPVSQESDGFEGEGSLDTLGDKE